MTTESENQTRQLKSIKTLMWVFLIPVGSWIVLDMMINWTMKTATIGEQLNSRSGIVVTDTCSSNCLRIDDLKTIAGTSDAVSEALKTMQEEIEKVSLENEILRFEIAELRQRLDEVTMIQPMQFRLRK